MPEFEFPPGVPEDMQHFITKKITKDQMEQEAFRHDFIRFFHELSQDQIHMLFHVISQASDIEGRGEYLQGYIVALLEAKFGICAGCGENHDKSVASMLDKAVDKALGVDPKSLHPAGWDAQGNRVASCSSCHGDSFIKVCIHQTGSHGQYGRETCPEPLLVPCPECQTPEWFTNEELPVHQGRCQGTLLPVPTSQHFVCSECGMEVVINGSDNPD